jgi:hypothetical protein
MLSRAIPDRGTPEKNVPERQPCALNAFHRAGSGRLTRVSTIEPGVEEPFRMMLRLRNSLFLAVAALLFLGEVAGPPTARAETRVGGTLSGQTHWTKANSPYVVVEDLDVPVGSALTIDPGVVVRFKANLADQKGLKRFDLELVVRGTLTATGADGDSVYFTSDAVDVTRGDWWGIILPEAGGKVFLDRVVIESPTVASMPTGARSIHRSQICSCNIAGCPEASGGSPATRITTSATRRHGQGVYFCAPRTSYRRQSRHGNQTDVARARFELPHHEQPLLSARRPASSWAPQTPNSRNNITQNEFGLSLRRLPPKVRGNNIFGNGTHEVKVGEYTKLADGRNLVLDLGGNWWGDVTADGRSRRLDDPNVGAVLKIEPILKEAVRGGNYPARLSSWHPPSLRPPSS